MDEMDTSMRWLREDNIAIGSMKWTHLCQGWKKNEGKRLMEWTYIYGLRGDNMAKGSMQLTYLL